MSEAATPVRRKRLGTIVSVGIPVAALMTGLSVVYETTQYPRTDDAAVFANFIGIAPQVDGPISRLAVEDNAFIKQTIRYVFGNDTLRESFTDGCLAHARFPDKHRVVLGPSI